MEHGSTRRVPRVCSGDGLTPSGRLRIEVAGRLAQALTDEITRRFGPLEVEVLDEATVITTRHLDQAAVRSLLDLLFDGAADVRAVTRTSKCGS